MLPVNEFSVFADIAIMGLLILSFALIIQYNFKKKDSPYKVEKYYGMKRFRVIFIAMTGIQLAKMMLLFFGTSYHISTFNYGTMPSSNIMSLCLMQFQMLQILFTIPSIMSLRKVSRMEYQLLLLIKI